MLFRSWPSGDHSTLLARYQSAGNIRYLIDVVAHRCPGSPLPPHRASRPVAQTIGGRDRAIQHRVGISDPIPLSRQQDPQSLDHAQPRLTTDTVESPLPRDRHGGFGERFGETDREQSRHRAPSRLDQSPAESDRHAQVPTAPNTAWWPTLPKGGNSAGAGPKMMCRV